MASKIGLVLALDGEAKFTQGMKNAYQAVKQADAEIKALSNQYKDNATSLEYLTKRQELLKTKQEAVTRTMEAAKTGQANAKRTYKEQAEALDALRKALSESQTELSKMSKTDAGYAEKAADVRMLTKAVDDQTANYLKAEARLSSWESKVKGSKTATELMGVAVEENGKNMNEAANSADKCAHSLDKMGKSSQETKSDLGQMGLTLKDAIMLKGVDLAGDAIRNIGREAVEAAKYIVDVGSTFEASMSKVEALSGASGSELDALSQKAQMLGRTTKFSASEAADAMANMALAGWNNQQMLKGIDGVLQLAAAADMDLAKASDVVAGNLAAFNMKADESGKLADIMATAQAKSKTTADQLAEAYSTSATNLTQYGQEVTTTTALLEGMASVNDTGSAAGTKLSAVMAQITQKMKNGAISIGDATVQVQDAQGNFRDLIDILEDVGKATEGLGDAQKAQALSKTFNRTSLTGVNELLAVGADRLRQYQTELQKSSGAAAEMADTMQDNLKGAITEFESAVSGVGIKVFNQFAEALTGIVDLGTKAMNVIANLIPDNVTSDAQKLSESIASTKDSMTNASNSMDDASKSYNRQAAEVDLLTTQLFNLSGAENKTAGEKARLRSVVEQLNALVPDLNLAYDEETDKLNTTKQAVLDLTEAYKDQVLQQTIIQSTKDALQKQTQAAIDLQLAKDEVEALKEESAVFEQLKTNALDAQNASTDSFDGVKYAKEQTELLTNALNDGRISQDQYDQGIKMISESTDQCGNMIKFAADEQISLNDTISKAESGVKAAQQAYDGCAKKVESMQKAAEHLTQKEKEVTKESKQLTVGANHLQPALQGNAEALQKLSNGEMTASEKAQALSKGFDLIKAAAESVKPKIEEIGEAAKEAVQNAVHEAEQTKRIEEIQKDSCSTIKENWQSLKEAAAEKITFSITTEFDGGEDLTTEKMNENLQSQIDGYTKYAENLEKIRSYVAQGIFSQEALSTLEEQGTDAANMINHIVWTMENQEDGLEQVQGISDKLVSLFNIKDKLSNALLGDQQAVVAGIRGMGSTNLDFSNLQSAIDNGLQGADKAMQDKISGLVETAKSVGATIPEGLAESINSGDVSAEDVIGQLQAAIQGQMEGLSETVSKEGGTVGDNLMQSIADALDKGDMSAITSAFDELTSSLAESMAGKSDGMASAAAQIPATMGEAVTGNADALISAVEQTAQQGAQAAANGINAASTTVNGAAKAVMQGAVETMQAQIGQGNSIGYNLAGGVAVGIRNGGGIVSSAATAIINQAIASMRAAGDIHSPSKKSEKRVGIELGKGVSVGIKKTRKQNASEAAALVSSTLQAAEEAAKKHSIDLGAATDAVTKKAIANSFLSARKQQPAAEKRRKLRQNQKKLITAISSARHLPTMTILACSEICQSRRSWTTGHLCVRS